MGIIHFNDSRQERKLSFWDTHAYSKEEQWHCNSRVTTGKCLLLFTSLLNIIIYRLNVDVIKDNIFIICSLMTLSTSSALFKKCFKILRLMSRRSFIFFVKYTSSVFFKKLLSVKLTVSVKSIFLQLFTIKKQKLNVRKAFSKLWTSLCSHNKHILRRSDETLKQTEQITLNVTLFYFCRYL